MKKIIHIIFPGLCLFATAAAFAESSTPNDAQIAAIVVTANTADINAGKLAEKISHNDKVKAFAKEMVNDHSAVNQQATALVKKLHVTPENSDASKNLKNSGEANLKKLKSLKGKEFDQAYIGKEVEVHQAVIDTLDKTLIPNAKNAELNDLLVKARPLFEAHLKHAQELQAALK